MHTVPFQVAGSAEAVVPSDTDDIDDGFIYVGTGGDVKVIAAIDPDSAPVTFKNWPTGALIPIRIRRVYSTGTTASNMLVLR